MDTRKERGRELAQNGKIVKLTQGWRVPSQSGSGSYFVRLAKKPSCTCPDRDIDAPYHGITCCRYVLYASVNFWAEARFAGYGIWSRGIPCSR